MCIDVFCQDGKWKEQVCAKSKEDKDWSRTENLEKGVFSS
jgi:hypothetical protein